MKTGACLITGLGLGAGLMYFLDPQMGRRRRALLGDQMTSLLHETGDALRVAGRDLGHRAQGWTAEARSLVAGEDAGDRQLAERVRSKLGRVISHPGSIDVTARDGRVTLHGPVLAHEVNNLLACVSAVPGVAGVDNQLDVHLGAGDTPGLQGGRPRPGEAPLDVLQANWAPATRLLVGATGGALLAWGFTRKAPVACLLGTAGLALAARSATNLSFGRLLGVTGGRRAVEVHKTITINAPVERVFATWARYANFPRFMAHLREVRDLGGGRSHWVAAGPAGSSLSWNAVVTRFVPDELLAWRSEPDSTVANAGTIRFEPVADGTRVDIRLAYNPPGGALGHFAALLFGADPKSAMDNDLVRLKSLIEDGKASAPGKEMSRAGMMTGE